ncbi:MAG: dockerin type I domain-containing protein [Phycisphaerales bacterium]
MHSALHRRALGLLLIGCGTAPAQPLNFTDLGDRTHAETFSTSIALASADDVAWFRIELPTATATDGFFDLWATWPAVPVPPESLSFTRGGLYNNSGERISVASGGSVAENVLMSFGLNDPRPPVCVFYPDADEQVICGPVAFAGQRGDLAEGVYWLAIAREPAVFGPENWEVEGRSTRNERNATVWFRIQPAGEPYCDGDFDWDGNVDQEDVRYLVNILGGAHNETGRWADYNRDGNEDQDDALALIHTIAGGGCQ